MPGTITLRLTREMADCPRILEMQRKGFADIFSRYQDKEDPALELLEKIQWKMAQPDMDYYFILLEGEEIGSFRVVRKSDTRCSLKSICILPQYQGNGYAQRAMTLAETLYPQATVWDLDTIRQEPKLCHLYEKMGYRLTGASHELQPGMTIVDYKKHIE